MNAEVRSTRYKLRSADASQFAPSGYPLGRGGLLIAQGFSSQMQEHAFEVGFDGFDVG